MQVLFRVYIYIDVNENILSFTIIYFILIIYLAMVAMVLPAKIKRRKISLATCLQLSNPQDEPCSNNPSIDSCVIRHDGFPVLVTDGCPLTSYRCKHLELGEFSIVLLTVDLPLRERLCPGQERSSAPEIVLRRWRRR